AVSGPVTQPRRRPIQRGQRRIQMTRSSRGRYVGIAVGLTLMVAACSPPSNGTSTSSSSGGNAATATSAQAMGGMSALVAAAKKEGALNVIALPPNWANYGALISGFQSKYGIKITSANPDGSSQDEVNAVKQLKGTS